MTTERISAVPRSPVHRQGGKGVRCSRSRYGDVQTGETCRSAREETSSVANGIGSQPDQVLSDLTIPLGRSNLLSVLPLVNLLVLFPRTSPIRFT